MAQTLFPWGRQPRGLPADWPRDAAGEPEAPALVSQAPEGTLAGMTASLLTAYGIPVFVRDQGDGTLARVVLGGSAYASELYVPASRKEEALELLAAQPQPDDGEA